MAFQNRISAWNRKILNRPKDTTGLNNLVTRRLQKHIEANQQTARTAVQRLIDEQKIAEDYIVKTGRSIRGTFPPLLFTANIADNSVKVHFEDKSFDLHQNAVSQLAGRLDIPVKFLKRLFHGEQWERRLAAENMNTIVSNISKRFLVRSVGTEVRAFLSDQYKRLDSLQLIESFLHTAEMNGAVLVGGHATDTRVFAEVIIPQPLMINTVKNGAVALGFGARLTSSDYGNGALSLRSYIMQGVCLNGMVRESVMRQIHLGTTLPENLQLSQEAFASDTKTQVLAIRDLTGGLLSTETIKLEAQNIQKAASTEVDFKTKLAELKKRSLLGEGEIQKVEKILMNGNPEDGCDGGNSLWKFVNGITAHAREASPERKRELEILSGELMTC